MFTVSSGPGRGTRITGQVPATAVAPAPAATAAGNLPAARTTNRSG
jgi:hypothetical protein